MQRALPIVTTLVTALAASLFAMPAIAQAGSGKDTTTTMDGTSAAMQSPGLISQRSEAAGLAAPATEPLELLDAALRTVAQAVLA